VLKNSTRRDRLKKKRRIPEINMLATSNQKEAWNAMKEEARKRPII
jgi:hypothetical protein